MEQRSLRELHKKNLEYLSTFNIPGSKEWMSENLPEEAIPYIREQRELMNESILHENRKGYMLAWTRYYKAILRAWELMAQDKTKGVPLDQVELELFMHLPDGTEVEMDSRELGGKFSLVPKKPSDPDPNKRYMTAQEALALQDAPIIKEFIKEFDAWFKM